MFAHELGTQCLQVLLVEDSRKEAHVTQRQLEGIDDEFAIRRVSTLKEAQERIGHDHIDAVVLDLGLPDSHGTDSIDALTREFPSLPLVVLSGQRDAKVVMRALEQGAQEFLLKGECSGKMIRQAILNAIFRKSLGK